MQMRPSNHGLWAALSLPVLLLACAPAEGDPTLDTSGESSSETSSGPNTQTTQDSDTQDSDSDSDSDSDTDTTSDTDTDSGGPDIPPTPDVRNYIFGHSLLLHSDTQNVPMWMAQFAEAGGNSYGMSGQYGFSDTHAQNLPPFPQWGVPGVTALWDEDTGDSFADVDFNTVLFTAANFRQYYPPTESDPDGFLDSSVVENTVAVFDWVDGQEPAGVRYLIYENWPDMAGFTQADFGQSFPTGAELADYYDYTRGDFHQWWLDYQDAMLLERPGLDVRMVPAGPVMAELLGSLLADVPAADLYEDDAPHGQPTLYFLAGLVTYMSVYGVQPAADFEVPQTISQPVRDLYPEVVDFIWEELEQFTDDEGVSRVW